MLKLDHVSTQLGGERFDYHCQIEADQRYAVMGASGCGKSTLLSLVAGFLPIDSGQLSWHGESLLGLYPDQRPVTTLFQSDNLFLHLDVFTNMALGLRPSARLSAEEQRRVHQWLERVGLPEMAKRQPYELSGGQQQRVALARCLLRERPILLLDEPYSALDAHTRDEMLRLTDEVVRDYEKTLLMVTHNAHEAEQLGARVWHMQARQLLCE